MKNQLKEYKLHELTYTLTLNNNVVIIKIPLSVFILLFTVFMTESNQVILSLEKIAVDEHKSRGCYISSATLNKRLEKTTHFSF